MNIKNGLKSARMVLGLNLKDVQKILGIGEAMLSRAENGSQYLPAHFYVELSELYRVSIDFLMTGENYDYTKRRRI